MIESVYKIKPQDIMNFVALEKLDGHKNLEEEGGIGLEQINSNPRSPKASPKRREMLIDSSVEGSPTN